MTEYVKPTSLAEAIAARASRPDYDLIAGCTDYMVGPRRDVPGLIDIFGLPELCGITEVDGHTRIGAATTYADILRSERLRGAFPALWQCASDIGAMQIQARGTIGGNIATSSPVGDTLPVLLALDAIVHVASQRGGRALPYDTFCTGYRKTALAQDELICAIDLPHAASTRVQYWRKVGTRQAQAISKVAVAASACLRDGRIELCRLAMGAVADRPIRLRGVEELLIGSAPTGELAERAALAVRKAITPIDDIRSTAHYRRSVAASLVRGFVLELSGRR